jgi:hypothetical protein
MLITLPENGLDGQHTAAGYHTSRQAFAHVEYDFGTLVPPYQHD